MLRKIKKYINVLLRKEPFIKRDISLPTRQLGSAYGGWEILPNELNESSVVYSFGVGEDISFDLALVEAFQLMIYAFDPTPRSIEWVEKQNVPNLFHMHPFGLAAEDGELVFYLPKNADFVSCTVLKKETESNNSIKLPVKSLQTIMEEFGHRRIDLIKMDIEGSEYKVLENLCDSTIRPKQILIEFHHRFPNVSLNETKQAILKLRSAGYKVFSVSDSNHEVGFVHIPD